MPLTRQVMGYFLEKSQKDFALCGSRYICTPTIRFGRQVLQRLYCTFHFPQWNNYINPQQSSSWVTNSHDKSKSWHNSPIQARWQNLSSVCRQQWPMEQMKSTKRIWLIKDNGSSEGKGYLWLGRLWETGDNLDWATFQKKSPQPIQNLERQNWTRE